MAYRELRINLRQFVKVEEQTHPLHRGTPTAWNIFVRGKLREAGFKFSKDDRPWDPLEEPKLQKPWCVEEEVRIGFESSIRIQQWDRNEEVPWYAQDRKEMLRWNILRRSRELVSSLRSWSAQSASSLRSWLAPILTWSGKLGQWLRKH